MKNEPDKVLAQLVEVGKERGFLTYEELNDLLPDETSSPEKIDEILMKLDEAGIELIDQSETEVERVAERPEGFDEEIEGEEVAVTEEAGIRTDDPVRILPHADGRVSAALARRGSAAGEED